MSRISFRSRPVDIDRQLPIVRDPTQLDGGDGVSRNVAHGHQDLDRENEKVRYDGHADTGVEKLCELRRRCPPPSTAISNGHPTLGSLCKKILAVLEDPGATPRSQACWTQLAAIPRNSTLSSTDLPLLPATVTDWCVQCWNRSSTARCNESPPPKGQQRFRRRM